MKKTKILMLLISMALIATMNVFGEGPITWKLDGSHSKVTFSVMHMAISEVEGEFKKFEGTFTSDDDDFKNAIITFTIDVNSVNTDNERRDGHLKSDDFFNAEKFPTITFKGKSFKKIDSKKYILIGDLTIRDVTKEIELAVIYNGKTNDNWGNTRAGFKVAGKINRQEFKLKWNDKTGAGDAVVSDEVNFVCNIELTKPKAK
jgi:polyisoprenoid-binding protein YceI